MTDYGRNIDFKGLFCNIFKSGLKMLQKDDGLRQEWGEKAKKLSPDNFNWEKTADRYLEVFEGTRIK